MCVECGCTVCSRQMQTSTPLLSDVMFDSTFCHAHPLPSLPACHAARPLRPHRPLRRLPQAPARHRPRRPPQRRRRPGGSAVLWCCAAMQSALPIPARGTCMCPSINVTSSFLTSSCPSAVLCAAPALPPRRRAPRPRHPAARPRPPWWTASARLERVPAGTAWCTTAQATRTIPQ